MVNRRGRRLLPSETMLRNTLSAWRTACGLAMAAAVRGSATASLGARSVSGVAWGGVAGGGVAMIGAGLGMALALPAARADEFIDRANALYADIEASKRSDVILIPALVELQAPPASVATLPQARLLPAGARGWAEAEAWAKGGPQQAALGALRKATEPPKSPREQTMAWGQGYGVAAVTPTLVRQNMYTELGDPPLLSAARFGYMPALDRLQLLIHVECSRLVGEAKFGEAIDLAERLVALGRQIADRQYFREARWGHQAMIDGLQRVRDVAYQDYRGKRVLKAADIEAVLKRLDDATGDLRIARMKLPQADYLGAQQAVALVMDAKEGPNERAFGRTMARLATTEFPLQMFSAASYWGGVARQHKNTYDTTQELKRAFEDYDQRWPLDWYNKRNQLPFYRNKLDQNALAVVTATLPDLGPLFELRQQVQVERVGTRSAFAMLGYVYDAKVFPPKLSSVAPRWVTRLEADPLNPIRDAGAQPPLEYFVPIRDTPQNEREDPKPSELNIFTDTGENFQVNLFNDQFVIYSWGADNAKGFAKLIENKVSQRPGADYLIWPSVLSLYRQHLIEKGQLQ